MRSGAPDGRQFVEETLAAMAACDGTYHGRETDQQIRPGVAPTEGFFTPTMQNRGTQETLSFPRLANAVSKNRKARAAVILTGGSRYFKRSANAVESDRAE